MNADERRQVQRSKTETSGQPTPAECLTRLRKGREILHRLTAKQVLHLPDPLPITAGRIHFIRQVQPDGTITLLNESWKVSKRLAGKYVWATIITHCRRLEIWYQRSAQYPWCLLKNCVYDIPEIVARLQPEFTHRAEA